MSTTNLSYSNLPDTAPRLPADDGAPSALVGNTPLLRIGEPFASGGSGFWAKLEGCNPGGMKDRPALHMVECARARGDLAPSARIVESTSGTLGLGLALAGTVYGHPVTLVTDPGLEPIVHNMLHAYGADVEVVSEAHPSGGWQQARRERVLELLAVHPGSWCPDQYSNPDNVAGYKSLALELLEQLDRVDVLVCSVGTGGHSAGVAQVLRQHYPDMRLVGVDAVGSTIFGQPARPRLMRGLGSSIFPANVDYDAFDEVHWLAPDEVVRACRALAATYHARRVECWGCRPGGGLGRTQLSRRHTHRDNLPRWAATILRLDLQRRLLQRTRSAERDYAHRPCHHQQSGRRRHRPVESLRRRDAIERSPPMIDVTRQFRTFDRPSQILMVNQFTINLGFYMLMPYLAGYLAGPLGLAAWVIGFVLGVRNFSQQGLFLVGGTLADRFGYKPMIIAGCVLRTVGFGLLAFASSLPVIVLASALTGFAGALFNPAVRAYLAADAGERRLEAFAVFNTFYQGGILLGPLVGLALTMLDFRVTCIAAAIIFGVLTVVQVVTLPAHEKPGSGERTRIRDDWRTVLRNRTFVLFAVTMISSYVLSFQVYLALPLQAAVVAGPGRDDTALVTALFVVSGLVAVLAQLRITKLCKRRLGRDRSLCVGLAVMAAAFVPLAVVGEPAVAGRVTAGVALLLCAALLAVGTAVVFPFEMDTIVALSGGRLMGTHYGFYNTIVGVGILLGNLGTGALFGLFRDADAGALVWVVLVSLGVICAATMALLVRARDLAAPPAAVGAG